MDNTCYYESKRKECPMKKLNFLKYPFVLLVTVLPTAGHACWEDVFNDYSKARPECAAVYDEARLTPVLNEADRTFVEQMNRNGARLKAELSCGPSFGGLTVQTVNHDGDGNTTTQCSSGMKTG